MRRLSKKRPRTPRRATAWLEGVLNPSILTLQSEWPGSPRRPLLPFTWNQAQRHISTDLFRAHPEIQDILEARDEDLFGNHAALLLRLLRIRDEIADFHGIPPVRTPYGHCPTCGSRIRECD